MIDDENNPEWQAVELALGQQIGGIFIKEGFCQRAQEIAQALCDDATKQTRERGLEFPDMVVVCFIASQVIRVYRRDADHAKKQQYIVRLIRACPDMQPAEIAQGFRQAWPDYKPHIEEKQASLKGPTTFPEETKQ